MEDYRDYFENRAPGVFAQDVFNTPRRTWFSTGVPAFIGVMTGVAVPRHMVRLSLWAQFKLFGPQARDSYLAYAVRGFFENGGHDCYVLALNALTTASFEAALEAIAELHTVDLVCAPDIVMDREHAWALQQLLVSHCDRMGDRFAILDPRFGEACDSLWEQWSYLDGYNAALYYPWVKVKAFAGGPLFVPPCGHIAGVYSRTDRDSGVHKAPANEVLEGVLDLEVTLKDPEQAFLNSKRINCLCSFPGRGIRVWGARTINGHLDWTYVNVRRLFLTAARWMEWHMAGTVFEPNDRSLWSRVEQELSVYFYEQYRQGALRGGSPEEAFYVKCNAETNPPEERDSNQLTAEVGLAPAKPFEFIVVRLIHGDRGVQIAGPARPL